MDRILIDSILAKLNVENPARLDNDRAMSRLQTRLEKNGIPADLTDVEKKFVESFGKPATAAETKAGGKAAGGKSSAGKAGKGSKAAKGGKKATKSAKAAKSAKATKSAPKAKSGKTSAEVFRSMFPNKSTVVMKDDLFKKLESAGVSHGTASSYVVWAKRNVKDKVRNPWGFLLKEEKDAKGCKTLQRVKDLA